jgi:hypothetical protein
MKVFASQVMHILTLSLGAYAMGHTLPAWAVKPAFVALVVAALLLTLIKVYARWLRRYQSGVILFTAMVLWPWLDSHPGFPVLNILGWAGDKVGVIGLWLMFSSLILMRFPLAKKPTHKTLKEYWAESDAALAAERAKQAAEKEGTLPIPPLPVVVVAHVADKPVSLAARRPAGERTRLEVPFKDTGEVKYLGAKFDWESKKWYVPHYMSLKPFRDWLPKETGTQ